ncbi:cobalamin biosynthesis protein, partial [Frankia canadensis]|uniref:cobalamin biosynthesis protein n=1 Tax=Frankia canadensis TaxID=1836972 RepID=UPI001A9C92E4
MSQRTCARLGGLVVGVVLDALIADPARLHPVAGFGQAAAGLERRLYRDSRRAGAAHTALLVAAVAVPAACADRLLARAATRPAGAGAVRRYAWSAAHGGVRARLAGRGSGPRALAVTAGLTWAVVG